MEIELEKLSTDLATRAAGLIVIDQMSASRATELILLGKSALKKIKEFFAPMKESAWIAHQEVVQKEKAELAKVEPVINALNGKVSNWRVEEDRKQRDAEAAAYRTEQLRIMAEADAKRKAEEALRAAERAEAKGNQRGPTR